MKLFPAICAAVSLAAGVTQAGQVPAPETGASQVNCRLLDGQLEMRDAATGAYLIAVQGFKLVRDAGPGVESNVTLQSQPTGADLIVTLTNTSSQPQPGGMLSTGVFNLGHEIEYLDVRRVGKLVQTNRDAPALASFAAQYPNDFYSPVMVLRNRSTAFGVSIQYPVMQYKHDVLVGMCSPPAGFAQGPAGRGWMINMSLSNVGNQTEYTDLQYPCMIPAGETRTYVISVRMTHDVDNWVTTLVPYRNYFRETYGGVQYQRRTSPVRGASVSMYDNLSNTNPYGFDAGKRPDVRGWGPMVDELNQFGFKSTMIWGLSGWYRNNPQWNFPYLVASQLRTTPKLATIFDPNVGLARLTTNNREVGVWWGRSLQICRHWDTNEGIPFNPDNPEHAALQLREMQAIYDTGARVVGLDTFNHRLTPIWKSAPWIRDMQARFPGVTFVTEPAMCDIMNLVAATWVEGVAADYGRPASVADMYTIRGPHILADFVVPGHEHWASLHYHLQKQLFGLEASPALIDADVRRYAGWGYVPVVFVHSEAPRNVTIARSWETSLPRAIVDNDPYIQNLKNGRLPNYVAPPPAPTPAPAPTPPPQPTPAPSGGGSTSGGSGNSGTGGAPQPRLTQQQKSGSTRKTTGFLGVRPSTKPVSGGQPTPSSGSAGSTGSSGSAGAPQPRIAVTITQRFNRKVRDPKLQADRTQGLLDAMNKQAREDAEDD